MKKNTPMDINCIKELETKHVTFKPGETYAGNKINDNYWIVDSVGIETKVFEEHFKASIEDKEVKLTQ